MGFEWGTSSGLAPKRNYLKFLTMVNWQICHDNSCGDGNLLHSHCIWIGNSFIILFVLAYEFCKLAIRFAILPFYQKSAWTQCQWPSWTCWNYSWWNHQMHFKIVHFNIGLQNLEFVNLPFLYSYRYQGQIVTAAVHIGQQAEK